MNIFYLLSFLLLFITIILFKKTNKTINIITSIVLTIALIFCLNMLLVFVLYYLNIPSTLFVLSTIYLIISLIIYYFIICKRNIKGTKQIQKYYFNKTDLIYLIFLFLICIVVGIKRFNNFNSINYNTVDPAVHYRMALKYSEVNSLLDSKNSIDNVYTDFNRSMTGSYVNGGIFINVFKNIDPYIAFMLYNTFILFLSASLFFITGLEFCKNKNKLLIFILTLFYIFGYPLCEYLFGFCYLGIGVFIINLIILIIHFFETNDSEKNNLDKFLIFNLALFNYCLYFSYYLFVPFIYLAEGLYFIYKLIKKEYTFKQFVLIFIFTLILPFIIGTCYFLLPGFFNKGASDISAITSEGAIYRNLLSNFYPSAILIILYLLYKIKMKKINFNLILIFTFLFGIVLLLILGLNFQISSYYFYKFYYVIWLIIFITILRILSLKNSSILIWSWVIFVSMILFITMFNIENKITNINALFNDSNKSSSLVDIYKYNGIVILRSNSIYNKEELELIKYYEKNNVKCKNKNTEIPVLADYNKKFWFYSITGVNPTYNDLGEVSDLYNESFDFDKWKDDNSSNCLIIFNSFNNINSNNYIDINYNDYNILYKNKSGYIISKL